MDTDSSSGPVAAWPSKPAPAPPTPATAPAPAPEPQPYQIRRIRQACVACRKRKTKCSGDRPTCFHCRRSSRPCVYEAYSNTNNSQRASDAVSNAFQQQSTSFHQRLSTLENAIDIILQQDHHQPHSKMSDNTVTDTFTFDSLPPAEILLSLMDTYFSRVHNRPYTFFHESNFMQDLRDGLIEQRGLPQGQGGEGRIFTCLLLAICAFGVRFSSHPIFAGRTMEASNAYSRAAWNDVMKNHLASDAYQSLQAIQCVGLLSIIDYTAGQVSAGWLRLGLAIRMAQEAGMMQEPPISLPPIEREERRRTCWSIYLVDRLISCAKSRPSAIWETDCLLRLPSDLLDFGGDDESSTSPNGSISTGGDTSVASSSQNAAPMTETLDQLLHWHTAASPAPSLSVFGLTILMVSVLGRCSRYMYGRMADHLPMWDPKSEFVAIRTSLSHMEQLLRSRKGPTPGALPRDAAVQTSRIIYTHCVFHLCHCLLNHPFLLRKRLQSTATRVPPTFIMQSFSAAEKHARKLTDLLDSASAASTALAASDSTSTPTMAWNHPQPVESIFAYCAMIAAGVHIMFHGHRRHQDLADIVDFTDFTDFTDLGQTQPRRSSSTNPVFGQYDTNGYFLRSWQFLQKLEGLWPMVANILTKLNFLVLSTDTLPDLIDTTTLLDDLNAETEDYLWSITDYGALARFDTAINSS